MPRRILEWKPMCRRIRGRPRIRWIEDVEEDIQTMRIRGWGKLSKERTEWKKIAEKVIVGCKSNIRRRRKEGGGEDEKGEGEEEEGGGVGE